MKEIPLTQGCVAIVDEGDYEGLMRNKWYATKMKGGTKAARKSPREEGRQKSIYMHRVIMNAKRGQYVDHRNHDTLDNRRVNLRLCTHGQNQANRHKFAGCASRFKGVTRAKRKGYWQAKIYAGGMSRLGIFADERDAAGAYNVAAIDRFGEFALLNIIE